MVKYNNSKIYKIEALNGEPEDIYIGSTTKNRLSERMSKHRSDYKRWKDGKEKKTYSYELFDKYGIENCKIVLIENVNATSLDELKAREAHYIRTLACVNRNIPLRQHKESVKIWDEKNKDRNIRNKKKWYEDNKERILLERKISYTINKEERSIKQKLNYEKNKEKLLLQQKLRYEKNKEQKINQSLLLSSLIS
jgi:hypothetical protein